MESGGDWLYREVLVGGVLRLEVEIGGPIASTATSPATAASPSTAASERHPGKPEAGPLSSRWRCYGDPKFGGQTSGERRRTGGDGVQKGRETGGARGSPACCPGRRASGRGRGRVAARSCASSNRGRGRCERRIRFARFGPVRPGPSGSDLSWARLGCVPGKKKIVKLIDPKHLCVPGHGRLLPWA